MQHLFSALFFKCASQLFCLHGFHWYIRTQNMQKKHYPHRCLPLRKFYIGTILSVVSFKIWHLALPSNFLDVYHVRRKTYTFVLDFYATSNYLNTILSLPTVLLSKWRHRIAMIPLSVDNHSKLHILLSAFPLETFSEWTYQVSLKFTINKWAKYVFLCKKNQIINQTMEFYIFFTMHFFSTMVLYKSYVRIWSELCVEWEKYCTYPSQNRRHKKKP